MQHSPGRRLNPLPVAPPSAMEMRKDDAMNVTRDDSPTLTARVVDWFKHAFDWMMG